MTKAQSFQSHALKRFEQRYNVQLGYNDYFKLVSLIQRNKAEFICQESSTRSMWKVRITGKFVRVIYDDIAHRIVTVLT